MISAEHFLPKEIPLKAVAYGILSSNASFTINIVSGAPPVLSLAA